jgi:hypothetical protein
MGRPKKPPGEAKSMVIPLRVTVDQHAQIKLASGREHLEMSTWLRKVALEAATAVNERAAKRARDK